MSDAYDFYAVSYFAKTNFRNQKRLFGIKQKDRMLHLYCMGKSGSGKTTLLNVLMQQDAQAGRGFAFFDPHGDAAMSLHDFLAQPAYQQQLIYFDVTSPDLQLGYNPLRKVAPEKHALVTANILEIFKRQWKSAWGMKMEHILRMMLLTLLAQPKADFSDIVKLLHEPDFRTQCLAHLDDAILRTFWLKEFPKYKASDLLPILNKVGGFLSHTMVRKVLIDYQKPLSLRTIMDKGQVLIINLAKGQIGSDVAHILGGLLLTSLASAAFSRIDTPESLRSPFFIYIDEFQTLSGSQLIAELLAQVRKFNVGLILANQFLHQLHPDVKASVLGNVGTLICFRLGITDARLMEKEFYPVFKAHDFTALPNYSIYLKLMIDGKPAKPFSADTIL